MGRFMIVVALAAVAFGANEVGKRFWKAVDTGEPTITDTKTPKRSATTKRSTAKAKGAQAKHSAGKSAKPDAPVTKAVGNAAKADTAIAKAVGNAVKADAPVMKADGNAVKADAPVTKADGNAAKAEAQAEQKTSEVASSGAEQRPEKKTIEVASRVTSSGFTSVTSSGTTSTAVPASNTSSSTNTSPDSIDFTATTVGQKLQKKSKLRSKIEAKLQATGYSGTVYEAAYGFQNVEELNAAIDLVQNHGYSFEYLKVQMTGKYVDSKTHVVYRAYQAEDGTVKLVGPELAANRVPGS